MVVGNHLEKPSEAFKKLEPITSKMIAKLKYKYFICILYINYKTDNIAIINQALAFFS